MSKNNFLQSLKQSLGLNNEAPVVTSMMLDGTGEVGVEASTDNAADNGAQGDTVGLVDPAATDTGAPVEAAASDGEGQSDYDRGRADENNRVRGILALDGVEDQGGIAALAIGDMTISVGAAQKIIQAAGFVSAAALADDVPPAQDTPSAGAGFLAVMDGSADPAVAADAGNGDLGTLSPGDRIAAAMSLGGNTAFKSK